MRNSLDTSNALEVCWSKGLALVSVLPKRRFRSRCRGRGLIYSTSLRPTAMSTLAGHGIPARLQLYYKHASPDPVGSEPLNMFISNVGRPFNCPIQFSYPSMQVCKFASSEDDKACPRLRASIAKSLWHLLGLFSQPYRHYGVPASIRRSWFQSQYPLLDVLQFIRAVLRHNFSFLGSCSCSGCA